MAGGLIAGIAIESSLGWPGWAYPAAAVAVLGLWLWRRLCGGGWLVRLGLIVILSAVLGAWRIGLTRHAIEPDNVCRWAGPAGELVELAGEVQTRPRLGGNDKPYARDPPSSFIVRAGEVRRGLGPWQAAGGWVQVNCESPVLKVEPGQRVIIAGTLFSLRGPSNPGARDSRRWLADKRILSILRVRSDSAIEVRASLGGDVCDAIRLKAFGLLLGEADALSESDRTLLDGLVLGRRGQQMAELSKPFLRTGTYHLLAISGLHMAILAGFCWLILRAGRVGPRRSAMTVLVIIVTYCLMVEPSPPIFRSAIMIGLACLATVIGRQVRALNVLSAAAVVLLAIDPGELFAAGFQLSFGIVLGLVLLAQPTGRWLERHLLGGGGLDNPPDHDPPLRIRLARTAISAVAVAFVAAVVGSPMSAHYFQRVYPWSIVGSLLLWLPVWLTLALGYLKMFVAVAAPAVAGWFNYLLHGASMSVLAAVDLLDRLPGSSITVGRPGWLAMTIFYVWLLAWRVRPRRLRPSLLGVGGLVAVLAASLFGPGWPDPGQVSLTVLDVGDGLCQVVEAPSCQPVVFDCGSRSRGDIGERIIVPFLASRTGWLRRLDVGAVFISHRDYDHYSGLAGLDGRGVGRVLVDSPGPPPPPGWSELTLVPQSDIPRRRVRAGDAIRVGPIRGQVLWPPDWVADGPGISTNNSSQVVRLTCAGRSILLTGDAAEFTQQSLLDGGADLSADVLVMPHHGGYIATNERFVRAVDPSIVLVSTSAQEAEVLARCPALRDPGRRVLVTSSCGAVTVRIGSDGRMTVETFCGNQQR